MRALGVSRTSVVPGGALAGGWARDPLWKNARAVPSLDLRFADNKSLGDAVGGGSLVTFTRASSGTFVGSDGLLKTATTNEPRFDHNPTTGESLGLLVEEARTNLFLQSNQFDTTWTNTSSSETAASGTAPDGTNTAWELKDTLDIIATSHIISQSISFVSGTTYTVSVWMKAGTLSQGGLTLPSTAFGTVIANRVNLSTGAVLASSAGLTTSVTAFPNDWYRITATATATATANASLQIRPMNGGISYIGTGTGTILIWGAQMEAAAFPTSYIPTTSATVTRAADVASITGSNFSSWYNQAEGIFFVESNQASLTPSSRLISASDNTTSNRIILTRASALSGNISLTVTNAGTAQVAGVILGSSLAAGTSNKVAAGYKAADFAGSINGLTSVTQGTGTIPGSLTQLTSGNGDALGNNPMTGTIKRLTYWPTRLANTTLQQITQP